MYDVIYSCIWYNVQLFKLLDKPKNTQKGGGGEAVHQRHPVMAVGQLNTLPVLPKHGIKRESIMQ
jgi:hypothetical protein